MGTTSLGIAFPDPSEPPRRQDLEDLATSADAAIAAAVGSGWVTYTPAWTASGTNPSIGNGSISGGYRQWGSALVTFHVRIVLGSTSNPGSGSYSLSLPVAASARGRWSFSGSIRDASPTTFYRLTTVQTGVNLSLFTDGGSGGSLQPVTHTLLAGGWAAGDEINLHGHYEPA